MKSKKLIAALSALTLGATMMAGTAMSASAITVTNNGGDGGFYTIWQDTNNDGTVDFNDEYTKAPGTMYDGLICSAEQDEDNDVELILQSITQTTSSGGTVTGYISSIVDASGNEKLSLYTLNGVAQYNSNGIQKRIATITPGNVYTITVTFVSGSHPFGSTMVVKFLITEN
ncbi:MAG: hypothetical protein V3G42_13180 [Oscillospiraceae bacterium]